MISQRIRAGMRWTLLSDCSWFLSSDLKWCEVLFLLWFTEQRWVQHFGWREAAANCLAVVWRCQNDLSCIMQIKNQRQLKRDQDKLPTHVIMVTTVPMWSCDGFKRQLFQALSVVFCFHHPLCSAHLQGSGSGVKMIHMASGEEQTSDRVCKVVDAAAEF